MNTLALALEAQDLSEIGESKRLSELRQLTPSKRALLIRVCSTIYRSTQRGAYCAGYAISPGDWDGAQINFLVDWLEQQRFSVDIRYPQEIWTGSSFYSRDGSLRIKWEEPK